MPKPPLTCIHPSPNLNNVIYRTLSQTTIPPLMHPPLEKNVLAISLMCPFRPFALCKPTTRTQGIKPGLKKPTRKLKYEERQSIFHQFYFSLALCKRSSLPSHSNACQTLVRFSKEQSPNASPTAQPPSNREKPKIIMHVPSILSQCFENRNINHHSVCLLSRTGPISSRSAA